MKTIGLNSLLEAAGVETSQSNKCHIKLGEATRVHIICTATALANNLSFLLSEQKRLIEEIIKSLPSPGASFELVDDMPNLPGKKGAIVVRLQDEDDTINLLIAR